MEYGNLIPRFSLPPYRSELPPVPQQVVALPAPYEGSLDPLQRLHSYSVQGQPYHLPEQPNLGRLREQQYHLQVPPYRLQDQPYQTQEQRLVEQRLLDQRLLEQRVEQRLMEQRLMDQHLMEQRLKKQRLSPQTEILAVPTQQRPRLPQTLQHTATDISGPISSQILNSDHILSDPILTEPLVGSLQQTPPADPIHTDQSLDDIHETNTFADSFEGFLEDWDVHQPHNNANTLCPKDVSLSRPKDATDGTTIEELKRLVESISKRNDANITKLAKSLANFADSDHRWKDQATQKLDKITRQLEGEESDL